MMHNTSAPILSCGLFKLVTLFGGSLPILLVAFLFGPGPEKAFVGPFGCLLFPEHEEAAAPTSDKESIKEETNKLDGTWTLVILEEYGEEIPRESYDFKFILSKGKIIRRGKRVLLGLRLGGESKGAYELGSKGDFKTIDITFNDPLNERKIGVAEPGIYVLEGDTLKICMDPTGKKRPTEFKTTAEYPTVLLVLRKEKP
jgi:uncharacterized protein (TIGR03067 family)